MKINIPYDLPPFPLVFGNFFICNPLKLVIYPRRFVKKSSYFSPQRNSCPTDDTHRIKTLHLKWQSHNTECKT